MDRRDFLRLTGMAAATAVVPSAAVFAADAPGGRWRMFEVTTHVEIARPDGVSRVWLPTPLTRDTPFEKALGNEYEAQGGTSGYAVDPHGVGMVWAEWPQGVAPVLVLKSRFATRDVAVDLSRPGSAWPESPATLAHYTAATEHMATTGAVKELSTKIVEGRRAAMSRRRGRSTSGSSRTPSATRRRAAAAWATSRSCSRPRPRRQVRGPQRALRRACARSQGIPARDVYGVRVADSALGYKSLGKSGDITQGAALPRRVLLARARLGAGRSGRRAQGDPRGSGGNERSTTRWWSRRASACSAPGR